MDDDDFHMSHCEQCIKRNCRVVTRCRLLRCSHDCGALYHECKNSEHQLLCPKTHVPCINASNGCPLKMAREKLAGHLDVCPASVIQCTMEWNRWPVYSEERKARVPFIQENFKIHARYGQLDVALALRDQRVLNAALKAPAKTRQALRNNLTQRFPAVPFVPKYREPDFDTPESETGSGDTSDDDSDTPWEVSKEPPGLVKSVCGELFGDKRSKDTCMVEKNTTATPENSSGDEIACVNYISEPLQEEIAAQQQMNELRVDTDCIPPIPPAPPPSLTLQSILGLDLNIEFITRYQSKPKSMYTFLCAQNFRRNEYQWHFHNVHGEIHSGLNGWIEQRCPLAVYGCTHSQQRLGPSQPNGTVIYSTLLETFGTQPVVDPSPTLDHPSKKSHDQPGYDAVRNKEKTPEIFTSRNFDSILQVDGNVCNNNHTRQTHLSPMAEGGLSCLPFELQRYLCRYLDSFSLCNLAVTSKALRWVCSTLLEERGIVVQEWTSEQINGKPHWSIGYKRWFFSTSCSPITRWNFRDNQEPMSNHLSNCPFYQVLRRTEPQRLLGIDNINPKRIISNRDDCNRDDYEEIECLDSLCEDIK